MNGEERVCVSLLVALPEAKAAVVTLTRLEYLDIASEILVEFVWRWHLFCLERTEHVTHRRDRDHPGRDLLGAGVRIVGQVEECVGEFLELRRRCRYL